MESGAEPSAQVRWQGNWFGVAEYFDALLGLIQDHRAVFAVGKVALEFLLDGRFEFAIDVVRQLANDPFAIQFGAPCRK